MKILIKTFYFLAIMIFVTIPVRADEELRIFVDGKELKSDIQQIYVDDNYRILVPLRFVAEALGTDVKWDAKAKKATIGDNSGEITIIFIAGSKDYTVNNTMKKMDTKAVLSSDGRVTVPIRFIAEGLGLDLTFEKIKDTSIILCFSKDIDQKTQNASTFEIRDLIENTVKITISAVGDCVIGTDYRVNDTNSFNHIFNMAGKDYGYFFAGVKSIFAKDNLTVANLEGTLTTAGQRTAKDNQDRPFWFKGPPEYAKILRTGGVDVVNIANNHSHDYNEKGYLETIASLEKENIGSFGYDSIFIKEIDGVRVGLLGFNKLGINEVGTDFNEFKNRVRTTIEGIKSSADLIIVSFHWGIERDEIPSMGQIQLGRQAIDAGADLILGHHSHIIQGIERYKGKHIVYSLGNFVYGGNRSLQDDGDTMIYQETFTFERGILIKNEKNIIPASYSSSNARNDYRPKVLQGNARDRVLEKLLNRTVMQKYFSLGKPLADVKKISGYREALYSNANIQIEVPKLVDLERMNQFSDKDLVNLREYIPDLKIELMYATAHNVTGKILYYDDMAFLRLGTAKKLKAANEMAKKNGVRLKLWDGYRPPEAQWMLWEKFPNPGYVGSPLRNYSAHNKGAAVDLTLVDLKTGLELNMPSKFDDFSSKANRDYSSATQEQKANARLLEKIMYANGFSGLHSEWWHYSDKNSPVGIIDIEKVLQ